MSMPPRSAAPAPARWASAPNLASVAQQFHAGQHHDHAERAGPGHQTVPASSRWTDGKSPVTYTRNGQFKVDRDGFIVNNGAPAADGLPGRRDRAGPARPGDAESSCHGGIDPHATGTIELE